MRPHLGGTYTVSSVLGVALNQIGIDLELFNEDSLPSAPSCFGSDEELARACLGQIAHKSPEVIYVNILSSGFLTNLCRYISDDIPVVAVVHNITPGTYQSIIAYQKYISHVVAVSPRIASDLVRLAPAFKDRISVVPTAVHPCWFNAVDLQPDNLPERSFLFAGRIEDSSKGVFKIAKVIREYGGEGWRLSVVGDGPDLNKLKSLLDGTNAEVGFLGALGFEALASQMAKHRFLLSPSNFEGQLLVNLEAMSVGCVPITSRIKGVTDSYVTSGRTGFLVDPRGSADLAKMMYHAWMMSDEEWKKVSSEAIRFASSTFAVERMAHGYKAVISSLEGGYKRDSLDINAEGWALPPSIRRNSFIRSMIPKGVKGKLRQYASLLPL